MDTLIAIGAVLLSLVFMLIAIFGYRYKKSKEIEYRIESEKLYIDALDYFVTICGKLLNDFSKNSPSGTHLTFRFSRNDFSLIIIRPEYITVNQVEILIHVKFCGDFLVDQEDYRVYTYSGFERRLCQLTEGFCVHDKYLETLMWYRIHKPEKYASFSNPVI